MIYVFYLSHICINAGILWLSFTSYAFHSILIKLCVRKMGCSLTVFFYVYITLLPPGASRLVYSVFVSLSIFHH